MNRNIQCGEIKLSIVMPVYNTEQYVDRCVNSVLRQTYKNLELIIVDDCSGGSIRQMATGYMEQDRRIRFVSNKENKGLFQARLVGAAQASGQYIAFIDSDDYVSCDFYHLLLETALAEDADITIGQTVFQDRNDRKYIRNFHNACFRFRKIKGSEVQKRYFGQQGRCFSWHTIWNKIYKKELWDRCVPYYRAIDGHVVMTEDIAFSSILFYFAGSAAAVSNEAYFYCENKNASTNTDKVTFERFSKNITDIGTVFDFVERFLEQEKADDAYRKDFHEWRRYYARMWRYMPDERLSANAVKKGVRMIHDFCPDETGKRTQDDAFFDAAKTPWNGALESLKQTIMEAKDVYVSFDIFDTLIQRPFYMPQDLFVLLNRYAEDICGKTVSFREIRTESESYARRKYAKMHPDYEDITIDEIYTCMQELYGISADFTDFMKEKEKELEIRYCGVRNAGKQLYEVALLSNKKILLISDMYLDSETMKTILKKNGYEHYSKLYLSSELRKAKFTGGLFQYAKKAAGVEGRHIYHIGDNWQSDYINAKKEGFTPIFFPKAVEVFENKIQGMVTNDCAFLAEKAVGPAFDSDELHKSIGYRCMLALVSNRYFDNPYRSFHAESDLNMDPCFIGYYTVGMHLVGLCTWILSECMERKVRMIHFLSRDGFLVKKAYDIAARNIYNAPGTNYLYASRRALFPGIITGKQSFYQLPVEYRCHSPKTLLEILQFASKNLDDVQKERLCVKHGWNYHRKFTDKSRYIAFIGFFLENLYSEQALSDSRKMAQSYYSCIQTGDVTFDMGYSGRIQTAISGLVGRGVDAWFVHSDHTLSDQMQRAGGYRIHNFYDYVPFVSGVLREHLLSDYGPACIGFDCKEGHVCARMEEREKGCQDAFVIHTIQDAAMDFVNDFYGLFDEFLDWVPFRATEVSLPFEGFLRGAGYMDRKIFCASYFEDQVYGADENINIESFINRNIPCVQGKVGATQCVDWIVRVMQGRSRWEKAVAYFVVDRTYFKTVMKEKFKNYFGK